MCLYLKRGFFNVLCILYRCHAVSDKVRISSTDNRTVKLMADKKVGQSVIQISDVVQYHRKFC